MYELARVDDRCSRRPSLARTDGTKRNCELIHISIPFTDAPLAARLSNARSCDGVGTIALIASASRFDVCVNERARRY